jgi:hypothetical protein
MTAKLGFRVLPAPPRLPDALVDRFRGLASPNIADAMGRFNFMDPGLVARTGLPLCGRAVTVNCRPADNLMVHKALQVAEPGDIVVVSTCGNTTSAVFGGLMGHTAPQRNSAGSWSTARSATSTISPASASPFSRTVPRGCDKTPGRSTSRSAAAARWSHREISSSAIATASAIAARAAAEVLANWCRLLERERARIAEIRSGILFRPKIDEALRKKGASAVDGRTTRRSVLMTCPDRRAS